LKAKSASPATIDDYIAICSPEAQERLRQIRAAIRKAAPDAEETINYGVPTFTLLGKNLVHFGAAKKHLGFYPTPSAIEAFKDGLSVYEGAKGSVQFPLDQRLPLGLIGKMVKFRVKQSQEKAASKAKKKKG
jgi:uncharacterized protein YdhG (YjbR/CyaY superfamily)